MLFRQVTLDWSFIDLGLSSFKAFTIVSQLGHAFVTLLKPVDYTTGLDHCTCVCIVIASHGT